MLTQTSRYALRVLGFLARRGGDRVPARRIAGETGTPANYVAKILSALRKQGVVEAEKGWGGGFRLTADAAETPIAEVVALFEGPPVVEECAFGLPRCDPSNPCPLHRRWERIRSMRDRMLTEITVGDLAKGSVAR